ncbi:glycosyltransferase [Peterkaempfera sp. SMS 1(5)a]|uniref:glycosyltransferase n=1 Tax=Peterkaempfera podocarpi TaxID=3232308 RepID=UPI003672A4B5
MRTPPPLISVVIPTYNRAGLLRRTLDSVAAQRLPAGTLEAVVADDGSSDATREVVREFEGRLPVTYHFQPDEGYGVARARNAGAALAAAPLLLFLDTGALLGPDSVGAHLAAHGPAPHPPGPGRVALGYTYGYNPRHPYPGLAEALERRAPEEVVRLFGDDPRFRDLRHQELSEVGFDPERLNTPWMFFWTLNLSLRTADFRAVGGFDEGFRSWGGEDLELGYRLHRHGTAMALLRDGWAVESPHERDMDANSLSNQRNAALLLERHPDPVMELYWAMYSRGRFDPPLEYEYSRVLAAAARTRGDDLADQIRAACAPVLSADPARPPRIAVLGAGAAAPSELPGGADWTLLDYDSAPAAPGGRHALGLRTGLPGDSFDLVVITSRYRDLWERWGEDLLTEARRLAPEVAVPFLGTPAATAGRRSGA